MQTFQPQRVPFRSLVLWAREAFALCLRKPLAFLALAFAWSMLALLPPPFEFLLLLALPLPLAAGCLFAQAADAGRSPLAMLRNLPWANWSELFLAGSVPWLVVGGFIASLSLALAGSNPWSGETDLLSKLPLAVDIDWRALSVLYAAQFLWLGTLGVVGWFLVPLQAVAGMPLPTAWQQAVRGLALNGFVAGVVLFAAWVCVPLLSLLSPLLAAPLLAFVSSMMYVSFRHIWLGRGMNEAVQRGNTLQPIPVTK